jgi:thiol-disulfide isomerase/thioredoxin
MKKLIMLVMLLSLSAHAKVVELSTPAQVKSELSKPGPFVVLYYTSWCGACSQYKPFFEKESNKIKNVRFYKMNLEVIAIKEHQDKVPYIPMLFYGKDEASFRNNPCIDKSGERMNLRGFFKRCQ